MSIRISVLLIIIFFNLGFTQDYNSKEEKALWHRRLGDLYYEQGRYKEAEEEYQKALELLREGEKKEEVLSLPKKIEERKSAIVETAPKKEISREEESLEYTIGEDDLLYIFVWQNPDLTLDVSVRPDGKISFPLIGEIYVKGLTLSQLTEILKEKLKEYIRYPEVSVSLKKMGGKKIIILGEVVKPGVYSVTGAQRILEAIAQAGGFTPHAVASSVVLIRGGLQNPQAKRLNLNRALKGDFTQNPSLQSEDIVFVPKKFISDLSFFLNQVLDPISKGVYTSTELRRW